MLFILVNDPLQKLLDLAMQESMLQPIRDCVSNSNAREEEDGGDGLQQVEGPRRGVRPKKASVRVSGPEWVRPKM